jgi:hypothetical protein
MNQKHIFSFVDVSKKEAAVVVCCAWVWGEHGPAGSHTNNRNKDTDILIFISLTPHRD